MPETPTEISAKTMSRWFVVAIMAYLMATTGVIWHMLTGRIETLEAARVIDEHNQNETQSDVKVIQVEVEMLLRAQGLTPPRHK